eukprot:CAMPEP_0179205078 /NCGR_PEP_ID=MMETSP0796-20121207/102237_1 /TAXON_ID=73915 /ORGANISM="Pyrodinium bahamense, Strain pbaha01" /LENGTH=213 /DNA_ID=CAMNT_0020909963 /DNA_START=13 /DNA_END=650 /DNA_ORIENTATION=+
MTWCRTSSCTFTEGSASSCFRRSWGLRRWRPSPQCTRATAVPAWTWAAPTLGAGDGLLVPYGWWHQVESLELENVSINFWFGGGAATGLAPGGAPLPRPLPDAALVELLRSAERFFALTLGDRELPPFLEWLQRPRAIITRDQPPLGHELLWLQCANYVLFCAAHLVPPRKAGRLASGFGCTEVPWAVAASIDATVVQCVAWFFAVLSIGSHK